MTKGCTLSTGYLPRGGLPRNSVDRITDSPDMTTAVDGTAKTLIPLSYLLPWYNKVFNTTTLFVGMVLPSH